MSYLVFNADGSFAYTATGSQPAPDPASGHVAAPCPEDYNPATCSYTMNIEAGEVVATARDAVVLARTAKTAAAQQYFDGLFALPNGFTFGGKLYQMDEDSRGNWLVLGVGADRSAANPTEFPWTNIPVVAADNAVAMMDLATAQAFSQATFKYWASCRPVFRAIKDAILAAPDQVALDAIDVTAGYPAPSI